MDFSSQSKSRSKQRHSSATVKRTVIPTQRDPGVQQRHKLKAGARISQRGGLPLDLRQPANEENMGQSVGKAKEDDELIKYMSNLPAYLQRVERGEKVQDNALNVGVLDWERLEKWKRNQKYVPASDGNEASLTNSGLSTKLSARSSAFPNAANARVLPHQRKLSLGSSFDSSCNDYRVSWAANPSVQNVSRLQDTDTAPKGRSDGQNRVTRASKPLGRNNNSDLVLEKGKRTDLDQKITTALGGHWSSTPKLNGIPIIPKENALTGDRVASKRFGDSQESNIKEKAQDQQVTSSMGASSSKLKNYEFLSGSKGKKHVHNTESKKRIEESQESTADLSPQYQSGEDKKIVLLLPKKFSQNSSLEESRTSSVENLAELDQNWLSDSSSNEIYSAGLFSEIPHSCPLPSMTDSNTEQVNMAHMGMNTLDQKLSSDASHTSTSLRATPARLSRSVAETSSHTEKSNLRTFGSAVDLSKPWDQETVELAAAKKGRHPSPNRRLSFSLGWMGRSSSLKEGSAARRLGSTHGFVEFGPVASNASAFSDDSNRGKVSSHQKGRSSPFRRILDPLLKTRGSSSSHSDKSDQSFRQSSNSFSLPVNNIESPQPEKLAPSNVQVQALLQFTIKNGHPLFRFAVNNNPSVLAATTKNLASPEKIDSDGSYMFYAIDEIKKRTGGWINQGSKEKSWVYNLVAQMKINSCSSDASGLSSNKYAVKETALFGVEQKHPDQASPKFMTNRELAAMVVKMPCENLGLDVRPSCLDDNLMEKGFLGCLPEPNDLSMSATVMLPRAVHGLPDNGSPTPLITRRRTGSCDCGGWDVGCALLVLSNGRQQHKMTRIRKLNHIELFMEEGAGVDKPLFRMVPMQNDMYSVEFSTSITVLQAFFICVTVVSCQTSPDLLGVSNLSEDKVFQEPTDVNDGNNRNQTIFMGGSPPKYTPCPPPSPVGRA